jgi:hypothetical protein
MPAENPLQKPAEAIIDGQQQNASASRTPMIPRTDTGKLNAAGDKPKWTDVAIVIFTVCLVGVAIWQGHIFDKQWQEMHSGGTDTHDLAAAAKAQAEEAKEQVARLTESLDKTDKLIAEATTQANAALKQADGTYDLARQAQRSANYAQKAIETSIEADRPWVGVTLFTVDSHVAGTPAKARFVYSNTGKRPAKGTIRIARAEFSTLPPSPFAGVSGDASVAFILPGATLSSTFDYDVPDGLEAKLKRDRKTEFFFAEIVYLDVETNISHITHFCSYWDPTNKDTPFPLCTRYNEAK